MATRFSKFIPVLRVSSMERSMEYYTRVLGFEIAWCAEDDGEGELCMLALDEIDLLLSTGDHLGGPPSFTGTLYISTTGVEDYYARIADEVDVIWPLEQMEYGVQEFGIRDPDGYLLAFSEAVDVDVETDD